MTIIKRTLAYLFAILFIFTTILALFLFNFDRKGFSAETYQKALANENFYNRIPVVLAEAMVNSSDLQGLPLTMQGMSSKAWEDFFRTLLPQDALKLIGDSTLDSMFAYLNKKTDSVTISLLPIKANMGTESGTQAILNLLATQPDCTVLQIAQMTINLLTAQDIQFCNPPAELTPLLTPVIQAQLQTTALIIPNEVTILDSENINPQNDPRNKIQFARTIMKLSPLLPLGFLLLLTLSSVNSLRSWLSGWGIPLTISGCIAIILGLIGAPIISFILIELLTRRVSASLPSVFANFGGELASAMVDALLKPVFWQGLILFIVGLGMVVVSYLLNRKEN